MAAESKTYRWREGSRITVPAAVAGPEIERIAAGRGVEGVTPEEVVASARSVRSPLHAAIYKMKTSEAAQQHRLHLARVLLGSLIVVVTIEDQPVVTYRPMVNLRDGKGYRSSVAVERDEDLRAQRVENALGYLRAARKVLAEVRGFADVVLQLSAIEARVERKRKRRAA